MVHNSQGLYRCNLNVFVLSSVQTTNARLRKLFSKVIYLFFPAKCEVCALYLSSVDRVQKRQKYEVKLLCVARAKEY
jgi:hypothetical protein